MFRNTSGRNYYETLGVTPGASLPQLKKAYRQRVLETHPDLRGPNADAELFRQVKEAYDVLRDPQGRDWYDMAMGLGGRARRNDPSRGGFGSLFANLFAGFRSVLERSSDLPGTHGRQRRQAG